MISIRINSIKRFFSGPKYVINKVAKHEYHTRYILLWCKLPFTMNNFRTSYFN